MYPPNADNNRPRITHELTEMLRENMTHFHGKSWSDRFICPECGLSRRMNLNYLGARHTLGCNGLKSIRMANGGPSFLTATVRLDMRARGLLA